ncbi:nuclear transport factor 2 family protein [Kineococcus sp. SYSU DK004]|uniref:nuclear transport factor 2 family protein n=1 Tax=Kineococcus sp. SYSU DK004 TaxID=3383125 RepID=UPI003D7D37BA
MTPTDTGSGTLPTTVRDFLAASTVHDADAATALLTDDVVVVDQGETFRGRDAVHAFVRDAGAEFEYTTEPTAVHRVDEDHWVVTLRLEGTFPGGTADLDHRFTLRGGFVAELVIANHGAA